MSDQSPLNADQIQVITITVAGLALTGVLFAVGLVANYYNAQADQSSLNAPIEVHIEKH
jgi:hypothetical protein